MQLIFQYYPWTIQATQGIVGRQYDNLAHSLVVQGPLPEGYSWDMGTTPTATGFPAPPTQWWALAAGRPTTTGTPVWAAP